ncbi:MAG: hypothetical protein WCI94_13265 [Rhodospirillales bacterium]
MPCFRLPLYAALTVFLTVGSARALELGGVDILNLRLGMAAAEVEAVLLSQAIDPKRWDRQTMPCPSGTCLKELVTPTRDGRLAIGFTTIGGTVRRIDYTFRANGSGEPEMIRASVLRRFGDPSDVTDTVWCGRISAVGTCPADRPNLRLRRGAGVTMVLSLSDGSGG